MAEKQSLKARVNVAWYLRIQEKPELAEEYGSNGWRVFSEFMEMDPKEKPTQERMAGIFGKTLTTMNRWHREYRVLNGVH
jgi:hypothetical protein